ncbi:MAG: carboxylating nicotinate-nucleotide diphosphorylase, partial [Deltaproteobacteria bacterium]|nr:carboxylating nicotinate-nucleotide diphosphorylase [Deltaproteobacteria bacterium]
MNALFLREAIKSFLKEDLSQGDITSDAIFQAADVGEAVFIAKSPLVCAGIEVAVQVFKTLNPAINCRPFAADGRQMGVGDNLLEVSGPVLDLLKAERVALNLCQRLCGIATLTSSYVKKVADLPVKIVDTRKTTPGLRHLEKYAVRVGGGHNHRFSLGDGVLIKDNHIAAAGSIRQAVKKVRAFAPHTLRIEVEAENLPQVEEAVDCGVDIILLDNMSISMLKEAVNIVRGSAISEASGGINLLNLRETAETGVDIISIGALTHSAPAS